MKYLWLLFIIVFFLGCSAHDTITNNVDTKEKIIFEKEFDNIRQMNGSIELLKDYKENLDNHFEQTKDTEALNDFVEIEINWKNAKINLESGSEELDSCVIYSYLERFVGNATFTVVQMQNFIKNYPEFLNQTEISEVVVEDINNNILIIKGIMDSEEFSDC